VNLCNACQVPPSGSDASYNTTAEVSTPSSDTNDDVQQSSEDATPRRVALADIVSCDEIDALTVRQLKVLLVNNYVDYKGCCEKQELVERVHALWKDHKRLNETGE